VQRKQQQEKQRAHPDAWWERWLQQQQQQRQHRQPVTTPAVSLWRAMPTVATGNRPWYMTLASNNPMLGL
jgi:hypothetical protein